MEQNESVDNSLNITQPILAKPTRSKVVIIFLVVFLVISVVGIVFLLIQNQNYKKTTNDLNGQLNQKELEMGKLSEENEALENEVISLQQQVDEYIKKLNELENPPYFTNYYPVKYLFNMPQMLGQSFILDEDITVNGLELIGSYGVGDKVTVTLYKLDKEPFHLNDKVVQGSYNAQDIVKEKSFSVPFGKKVELEANIDYIFILEATNAQTQAGIAFAEADIEENGKMWSYTRLIGGNGEILDTNHSWQPRNSHDVIYKFIVNEVDKT